MRIFGGINAVVGVLVAAVPYFTNCLYEGKFMTLANGMKAPMKCYWTAEAEIATGVSLAVLGILLMVSRNWETTRALSLLGAVLGAFVILLPTALIGVCSDMTASCNLIMRPSMILLGAIAMATSGVQMVVSQRRGELAL